MDYDRIYQDIITPMHKIFTIGENNLYLGSQNSVGGFPDKWNYSQNDYNNLKNELKEKNVKYIVCCADNLEVFSDDFEYLQIPMQNNKDFNIMDILNKSFKFINEKIKNGSIVVHCNAGCTRSATVVINFLMKYNNWSYENTHSYVKNIRSCIDVDIFKPQIMLSNNFV
jgi:protein-tyrosine phosphatase